MTCLTGYVRGLWRSVEKTEEDCFHYMYMKWCILAKEDQLSGAMDVRSIEVETV